ncbi:MAG: hypothetical protein JWM73_68 [Solirubrobacterales bacterium]|jgi:hypothetical protein|nr:hypothetical protein [Solirubrobacterales bacterium]
MSDEHGEEAVEPEAVAAATAIEEVSDEALDEIAGGQHTSGLAAEYMTRPTDGGG